MTHISDRYASKLKFKHTNTFFQFNYGLVLELYIQCFKLKYFRCITHWKGLPKLNWRKTCHVLWLQVGACKTKIRYFPPQHIMQYMYSAQHGHLFNLSPRLDTGRCWTKIWPGACQQHREYFSFLLLAFAFWLHELFQIRGKYQVNSSGMLRLHPLLFCRESRWPYLPKKAKASQVCALNQRWGVSTIWYDKLHTRTSGMERGKTHATFFWKEWNRECLRCGKG